MKRKPARSTRRKKKRPDPPTWKTKDGEEIPIRDMRDGHLLNAHRMLRRNRMLTAFMPMIIQLEAEIERREMEALPVFNDSVDEASHLVKQAAAAVEAAKKLTGLDPFDFPQ